MVFLSMVFLPVDVDAVSASKQRLSGFIPRTASDVRNLMEASDVKCGHSSGYG
jgi:hypothetical protein